MESNTNDVDEMPDKYVNNIMAKKLWVIVQKKLSQFFEAWSRLIS
jgi:hypothetical protein